ncbi:MAG: phytanoyl-CoA dioxygenase family protein [Thermoleophilia bacterium]|nr:phytanoyl-CoA dioxygenase family protein [Thermoleophilia bacterium]
MDPLEALDRDGFAVVADALPRDQVTALVRAVDRVWRERSLPGEPLHQLAFLGLDDAFLEPLDHPLVLPIVVGALGWNVFVYHCHLDVHPPLRAAAPVWGWHQDGGRQNVDLESPRPRLSVKAAYFLTDVATPRHGALWVLPGSQRRDTLPRPDDPAARPPGAGPLLVRAGTAVVFDRRLWHARGENESDVVRKVLFYAYTYRWIRPRDDAGLTVQTLAALTPVRRQLAGAGTGTFGHWFPSAEDAPLRALAWE